MPNKPTGITPITVSAHEGYASGSKVLDRATWEAAVRRMLSASETVQREIQVFDQTTGQVRKKTVTVDVHETDPPEVFVRGHARKPGELPEIIEEVDIPKGAKIERQEHSIALPSTGSLDQPVYHMARHIVIAARARHAMAIALRDPVTNADGSVSLPVIFVVR